MEDLLSDKEKKRFLLARKLYLERIEFNPFFVDIAHRLKSDDDCIVCLGGQRRTGKSTVGMQTCLYGFQSWTPWQYMFFTIEEAMFKIENSKPGEAYFWDEIGTDYTAYRFMSTPSVRVTSMLEMVGDKNLLLVFTAPSFKSFAAGGRKNVTHYVSVRRKMDGSRGYASAFRLWLDDWSNRVGRWTLCDWDFTPLPKIMYETYDVFKRKYLDDYLKKSRKEIFLSNIRKELPSRVYDVFYNIYLNDGDGIKTGELRKQFPSRTVDWALNVLRKVEFVIKDKTFYHINPNILPK